MILRCGDVELNLGTREAFVDGQAVVLVGKPFDMLAILVKNQHRIVRYWELAETLWKYEPSGNLIHRTAYVVRSKVGDRLKTCQGYGYRIVARSEVHA